MIHLIYTLKLHSSMRVATGIGAADYLDNTVTRSINGLPLVPGSSIKGRLRAETYRLAHALGIPTHPDSIEPGGCPITQPEPCIICRIFGAAQWPCGLFFDNAHLDKHTSNVLQKLDEEARQAKRRPQAAYGYQRQVRTNVSLSRRQRTALPDHLVTYEAIGTGAEFHGVITGNVAELSSNLQELALLIAGMRCLTHLGGGRGRGYGRCDMVVDEVKANNQIVQVDTLLASL